MNQLKYVFQACAVLALAGFTFLFFKPLFQPSGTAAQEQNTAVGFCGNVDEEVPAVHRPGKALFQANCGTCHSVMKSLVGPALAGVETRGPWRNRKNLLKWVRNPAAFIPPTTKYTRNLAAQANGQIMPSFSQLSDAEILAIFDYVRQAAP